MDFKIDCYPTPRLIKVRSDSYFSKDDSKKPPRLQKNYRFFNMVVGNINDLVSPGVGCPFGCISTYQITVPGNPNFSYPTAVISLQTWKQLFGMEQIWQIEFHNLFLSYYPNIWYLSKTEYPPPYGSWHTFVDSAKVRFCCEECGHGWTSMKGRIVFWFQFNIATNEGVILFKLFGQQCDKCKDGARYEKAMWYPEEVKKVLFNLFYQIGVLFYGFERKPINKTRRPGKPRTPHNSSLCQACSDGVCFQR